MSYIGFVALTGNKNKVMAKIVDRDEQGRWIGHARDTSVIGTFRFTEENIANLKAQGRWKADFSDPTYRPSKKFKK